MRPGHVWLVGAGPGDPGLLTVRARQLIESADAVVHDRLVGQGVLDLIPPSTLRLDVGKTGYGAATAQPEIEATLIRLARQGLTVVRLKGGDPFVFGRGGEEALALRDAGIPFHVVPGVTSGTAAPALAGIPVTHRGMARSVAFVTATTAVDETALTDPPHDWGALARLDTLVVYMAGRVAPSVARRLLGAGRHPDTPAALITDSSLPSEKVRITDLASLAASDGATNEGRASLLVIGAVVALQGQLDPDAPRELVAGAVEEGRRMTSATLLDPLVRAPRQVARHRAIDAGPPGTPWVMAFNSGAADPEARARIGAGLDAAQVGRFGWLVLRTCQRVELLGAGERPTAAALVALSGVEAAVHAQAHTRDDAARHVLRLAAGLESVVVGEDQVLDQVRSLRRAADRTPLVDGRLVGLLDLAIHVGRRARAERPRSEHSLADRALAWLEARLGSLQGAHLLIVGSGPIGKESARLGTVAGARVSLASRTQAASESGRLTLEDAALLLPFADGAIVALAASWSDARRARLRDQSAAAPFVVDLSSPPAIPDPLRRRLGRRMTGLTDLIGRGTAADAATDAYVAHAETLVDAAVERLRRRFDEEG